ncbi:MAG: hypothetical protein G01um101419_480, partial [Parcubacteria group bacterium Gr01-1014_19]
NWEVYRDAKTLMGMILKIVKKLPQEYRFELSSQIIRSGLSIVLNIAEGSGKTSEKELNRFLDIALGSASETFAAIDVLLDNGFISQSEFDELSKRLYSVSNQLGGFKKKINSHKSSVVSR